MCPLLRSCQDTWRFRNFCMFLTNCIEGGCSKRKPDINSPFKQGKALERLAGLCCAVEEAAMAELGTGKTSQKVFTE